MENQVLYDICKYIDFLRECGFSVVLCGFSPVLNDVLPTLLSYEPHLPNICSYLKSKPKMLCKCMENKAEILNSKPERPYYRSCYAGVEEYIIPITNGEQRICLVSISGYVGKLEYYENKELSADTEYKKLYKTLLKDVPPLEKMLEIISPLKYMFFELYKTCLLTYKPDDGYAKIYSEALKYMHDRFAEIKKTKEISEALNYSASYLRYVFLKQSGRTITEHLRSIRLTHAANLLRFTNLSVTRISEECGFPDSSYFSTVFKNEYKISPVSFRHRAGK